MRKWYTVKDMLDYCNENNINLLSSYGVEGDFWNEYRTNHAIYDQLFTRLYKNYRYFNQDIYNEEETLAEVTLDFIVQVASLLLINKKKYEELKRINDITDSEYDLFDNIDYQREEHSSLHDAGSIVSGQREDTTITVAGQRQDVVTDQTNPYDNTGFVDSNKSTTNKGQEQDSETVQKGSQTDTTDRFSTNDNNTHIHGKDSAMSKSEAINDFRRTWEKYSWYTTIFTDIAKELLLV